MKLEKATIEMADEEFPEQKAVLVLLDFDDAGIEHKYLPETGQEEITIKITRTTEDSRKFSAFHKSRSIYGFSKNTPCKF